ncbi:hypothetical protein MVEG_10740 [Podila verticillata NRRL 6337]|nr:hypothetical protein MVEG_10740 [Podila verticillata NRRL 6337]
MADMWTAGCILYELCALQPAFPWTYKCDGALGSSESLCTPGLGAGPARSVTSRLSCSTSTCCFVTTYTKAEIGQLFFYVDFGKTVANQSPSVKRLLDTHLKIRQCRAQLGYVHTKW